MSLTLSAILNLTSLLVPSHPDLRTTLWSVSHSIDAVLDIWTVSVRVDSELPLSVIVPRIYESLSLAVGAVPYPGLVVVRPRIVHIIGSSNPGSTWGRGQTHFTFSLRTIQLSGAYIWNNISDLEVENPIRISDVGVLIDTVQTALSSHTIFGYSHSSPLLIRGVEVVLSTKPICLRLLATRPGDPDCEISLPRHIHDYDLTSTVRLVEYRRETLVYHVSTKDLSSAWYFEFCANEA